MVVYWLLDASLPITFLLHATHARTASNALVRFLCGALKMDIVGGERDAAYSTAASALNVILDACERSSDTARALLVCRLLQVSVSRHTSTHTQTHTH